MSRRIVIIGAAFVVLIITAFVVFQMVFKAGAGLAVVSVFKAGDAGRLLGEAEKQAEQGDENAAAKTLQTLIAEYPDSPQTEAGYLLLGWLYDKKGSLLKAKAIYQKAIEKFPASGNASKIQGFLDSINIKILFSPIITPDSFLYEVQKGDTLMKIAKKHNTTLDLIMSSNGLSDQMIKYGKSVKISKARFSVVVDKSQNILTLKSDGEILKTYTVSTGKNSSTPVGTFKITNRIINPVWYAAGAVVPPDSPNNILGSRWMGISQQGYGIHGTTDPQSIGKSITAGCIRMKNSDVEELYSIIPEGTEVTIID